MLKFGLKVGVVGATYYYLAQEGIWEDSDKSVKAYDKLCTAVRPYVHEVSSQIPVKFPDLPSSERVSFVTKHYWNQGVMSTFEFIQNIPAHACKLGNKGKELLSENSEISKFFDSFKTPNNSATGDTLKPTK